MKNTRKIFLLVILAMFTNAPYVRQSMLHAGAMMQPPFDPKKKKAGDECTSSDECQRHHKCEKSGDAAEKGVCVAPPPPKLPPGVVT